MTTKWKWKYKEETKTV